MPAAIDSEARYLAVGHVTIDVIVDARGGPRRQPGGGAFYSALQASRLGLRAGIVTAGVERELRELLEPYAAELEVDVLKAEQTTTFETRGSGAERVQRIVAWAGPLPALASAGNTGRPSGASAGNTRRPSGASAGNTRRPSGASAGNARRPSGASRRGTRAGGGGEIRDRAPVEIRHLSPVSILHLAPVAAELAGACGLSAPFVGLTPQGLMRRWKRLGEPLLAAPLERGTLPRQIDAAVLSEAERELCAPLLAGRTARSAPVLAERAAHVEPTIAERAARSAPVIAVTAGAAPTTLVMPDGTSASFRPPALVSPVDDLGAGDVFAAAFFVALAEGVEAAHAVSFANAAAAVRVGGGEGPNAIGGRESIEKLLRESSGSRQDAGARGAPDDGLRDGGGGRR